MRAIVPGDITLVASSVTGSSNGEFNAATTYSLGDKVKVSFASGGVTPIFPVVEYESLAGSNVGHYPPDDPINWASLGAENRCKMFDEYTNTETVAAATLSVEIGANGFNTIGLFGVWGSTVTLKMVRDGITKKEETTELRSLIPESGWYSWLFDYYVYDTSLILWSFPKYFTNATIEIDITTREGSAKCGMVVIGNAYDLGISMYGPRIGIEDYSVKDTDSLGRTYLNQGSFAKRVDLSMHLLNRNIDYVYGKFAALRGVASIFDLNNDGIQYQSLIVYGYPKSFDITIPGPIRSTCNQEIIGLI